MATRSRNTNNEIWNFFQRDQTTKIAECNFCKKGISYKSTTSNLKQHLKLKHIGVYQDFLGRTSHSSQPANDLNVHGNNDGGVVSRGGGGDGNNLTLSIPAVDGGFGTGVVIGGVTQAPTRPIQRQMSAYLPRQIRPDEKKKIDKCLLSLITEDFQPFSIVEDRGFNQFVAALNPNYVLPNRKALATTLLQEEYTSRLSKYQEMGRRCTSICLTIDCWTSKTLQSYMAITGHFIDANNMQFSSFLVQCAGFEGHHTGDRIAAQLRQVASTWAITGKVNFLVSDNATNMMSAASILGWPHYGCYAHKLNLIVQAAVSDASISCTINKVQKTVAHFKRSTIAKEKLLKYQSTAQNIAQPRSLLISVPTRWNSIFFMLKRFSELQEALRATIPNLNADLPIIPMEEWKCIDQICEVLQPFEEVTRIMSAENYLTASKAVVLTSGLINMCDELLSKRQFCDIVNILITHLKSGVSERFGDIERNKAISICTLLDPRFKQHAFEDRIAMACAKEMVFEKMKIWSTNNQSDDGALAGPSTNVTSSSTAEPISMSLLWGRFDSKIASSYVPKTTEEKCKEELELYLSENVIPRTECPMQWWKERRSLYPVLSNIFVANSNIVVTSVPCERVFSKAGYTISERRSRLTTSKVEKIMFLNCNK